MEEAASPLLSVVTPAKDPGDETSSWKSRMNDRLHLEAQRRSVDFYIGEYLTLRRAVFSELVTGVRTAEDNNFAGDIQKLVDDVWRWIVTKDQIQSDLVVMNAMLEKCSTRASGKLRWQVPCCGILGILAAGEIALTDDRRIRSVGPVLWTVLGLSGLSVVYTGLGYWLVHWFRRRANATLRKLENDELVQDDRSDFAGWIWNLPRFTNAF